MPRGGPDWERRNQLGWFGGLLGTVKGVLFDPVRTFGEMKLEGYGPALGYTAIFGGLGTSVAALWQLLFFDPRQLEAMPGYQPDVIGPIVAGIKAWLLAMVILGPLLAILSTFVVAAMVHLGLMIVGGARQPFEATFRAVAYGSSTAGLFRVLPACGGVVAIVWIVVLWIIGAARVHNVPYGKAALGALLLPVGLTLFCCCGGVLLMFLAAGLGSMG